MLINSKEALLKAKSEKFAIISANFIDNNSARVFVKTAEDNNLPIILSYAQSHANILSIEEAASFGKYLAEKSKSPVILHLDHGQDIDTVLKAIELGFSSVMIDASSESFENNIRITKEDNEILKQKKAVGDIVTTFYDINANEIETPLTQKFIGLNICDLKKINEIVALASGEEKYESILALLNANIIDTLIIDYELANLLNE